jgi:predicted nucleotidyltransferase
MTSHRHLKNCEALSLDRKEAGHDPNVARSAHKGRRRESGSKKGLKDVSLSPAQMVALDEIREELSRQVSISALKLFGSVVRGECDEESDIDVLVITNHALTRVERHRITKIIFHVNLRHETNFSSLVIDRESWERGPVSILPIHDEITREGVAV